MIPPRPHRWRLAVAILAASGAALGADPARAETRLKIATLAPEGSTWVSGLRALDHELQANTARRVGLRVYPGGVQGDDPAILDSAQAGRLDGAALTGVGMGRLVAWSRVLELPFQLDGRAEAAALRAHLDAELRAAFAAKGWAVLGWLEVGPLYLFSRDEIRRPGDLASARPWVLPGDPFAARLLADLGAAAVELPLGKVREALARGKLDTVYHAPAACLALQWSDKVRFMLGLPLAVGAGLLAVRESSLAELAPADRAALVEIAGAAAARIIDETARVNRAARETLLGSGMRVVELAPPEVAAFRAAGWNAARALAGTGPDALFTSSLLQRVERRLRAGR